ncbi:MAG: SH3 domain-containing protein [Desulfobacteraceae bacterium]|jgi:hypothetical protein
MIFPYTAVAIPGDIYYVQVDVANMRQGNSLDYPVIGWLKEGHKLMEIQRKGEWVEVVADWAKGQTGWIHSSIIDKNYVAGQSPTPESEKFPAFKNAFDILNQKVESTYGKKPFIEVKDLGDGVVQIKASDFWLNDQTDINQLYSLLKEMGKSPFPIAIHIVDQDGNRHLSILR